MPTTVGLVVAAIVVTALVVRHNRQTEQGAREVGAAIAQERPIPASPWQGEIGSGGAESGLAFVSEATMGRSADDIAASADSTRGQVAEVTDASTARVADAMHTMRIDGSSLDTMVDSINAITASLPDEEARAFQKAVRVLMVASLPIAQLRAQKVAIDKLPPEQLIGGAQKVLSGRTPLEVLQMAQARINAELVKRAKGYGPEQSPAVPGV